MIENEKEKNDNLGSVWLRQLRQRSTHRYENCGVVQILLNSKSPFASPCKGRSIRKLMGGGGGQAKYKKKNSLKGKLNEKKFMHAD